MAKFAPKLTVGDDTIPIFLSMTPDLYWPKPLVKIINIPIHTGTFADLWKKAGIILVYKKRGCVPSRELPSNLNTFEFCKNI